jgi:hypothetical protein
MGKINLGRVILGGIVAGVIIDFFEFVLNGVILDAQWKELMPSLNLPALGVNEIVWFDLMGFAMGIVAVWIYAAIRPRFGEGPKTALYAALVMWITSYVFVDGTSTIMHVYTPHITMVLIVGGLVEIVVATLAGAYFYKE